MGSRFGGWARWRVEVRVLLPKAGESPSRLRRLSDWRRDIRGSHVVLIALGVMTEIIYLVAFLFQFPLLRYYRIDVDMGQLTRHSFAGFAMFVGSFTLLFIILTLGTRVCRPGDRTMLKIVLAFGVLFALTLTLVYPVTAIDLFSYVAQSRILVHYHQNPIFVSPSRHATDPIMLLAGGWMNVPAPYGPLGIVLDALPSLVAMGNLLMNLLLLKLFLAALLVPESLIVFRILQRTRPAFAVSGALFVAWNPLVLFETVANGHNDILMLVLASLGLLALIEGDLAVGIVLTVASALIKYATLPLIPLALLYALTRTMDIPDRWWLGARSAALSTGVVIAMYAPFWQGASTFSRSLLENSFHLQSFGSFAASSFSGLGVDAATWFGRLLFLPFYGYAVWLSSQRRQNLPRAYFIALFFFLALGAANFKIWYAVWPVVFAACLNQPERWAAVTLAFGATISAALYDYIYLWLGQTAVWFSFVNRVAYLTTFLPALVILLGPAAYSRIRPVLRPARARNRQERSGLNV